MPPRCPRPARSRPAWHAYIENTTFRWAVVCLACYGHLDHETGCAEIGSHPYNLTGAFWCGKAAVVDEAKYQVFLRKVAAKLGIEF
jgi:hypothetical protein